MKCDKRDQDILLLAHGALPLSRCLAVQAHVRRCPACRERYDHLVGVSATLASALGAPRRPVWTPAWRPKGACTPTFSVRLLAVLSLLLIAATATVVYLAFSGSAPACPKGGAAQTSQGCAPNLPNDRCR